MSKEIYEVEGTANALAKVLNSDNIMKIVTEELGYTRDEVLEMNVFQVRDLIDEVEQYVN